VPDARRYSRLAHGLRAAALVIPGLESEDEWERFEAQIMRSLDPRGAIEVALAARVAESLWRLGRITRTERDHVVAIHDLVSDDDVAARVTAEYNAALPKDARGPANFYLPALIAGEERTDRACRAALLPRPDDLEHLIRYEAHLSRQLYQALHELEARQARRTGDPAPLARLDVSTLTEA